jgi:hypothetical protein
LVVVICWRRWGLVAGLPQRRLRQSGPDWASWEYSALLRIFSHLKLQRRLLARLVLARLLLVPPLAF